MTDVGHFVGLGLGCFSFSCFALICSSTLFGSLTSLHQRLVKIGRRLLKHARYYWLLLAEAYRFWRLFDSTLTMIATLPLPEG